MKNMRKHLALLLAVSMLLGLIVVSSAISVSADPTAILELDMSNLAAETFVPTNPTEAALINKTSGITTSGTWAANTVLGFAARKDGQTVLTKGSFANAANGTTYYLDYSDSTIYPNLKPQSASYSKHLTDVQFFNTNLESADNTISFWVDATASAWWKEILCYRVGYTTADGSSTTLNSFDLGINPDGTWNAISLPWVNAEHADAKTDGAFAVAEGWKHVVITNPDSVNNTKTMSVYVDGELKKNVTLNIPSDATVNNVAVSFFSKSDGRNGTEYWRSNYWIAPAGKLADVKVYSNV